MFNPINLEIFNNLFSTICEEMGVVLCKSSFSTNIKERKDFSCALFDSRGEMVAQAEHLPVHLASMSMSVKEAITALEMSDGDAVILNDPFQGGTHLPDITLVTPFFYKGRKKPVFYVANRAHHSDVGGMVPGSMCNATEIYQEGIRIPPVKIVMGNVINSEIMNIITSNVRTPEEREWDIIAQISANRVGKQRLRELCEKYGKNEAVKYSSELQDYSARIMKSVIKGIPDGEYSFSDYLDDDGVAEKPVRIKVCIKIKGNSVSVDFSGSSRQVGGSVNAVYAVTVSCVFYVFRCLVDGDIPSNSGCMRSISITAPEGSVVNARVPSAVSGGNVETSQRIVDVVFGALSKAICGNIPAASSGTMNNIAIGGYDALKGNHFTYYETIAGGMGARPDSDGINAIHTHMTNTLNTPVEAIEHNYPFRIRQYKIRPASGGMGRYKGGHGIIRDYEFFQAATVSILSDRRIHAPYGLMGGKNGQVGQNILISKNRKRKLPSKTTINVDKGDIISIHTPGGGGFGRKKNLKVS
ncbi:N-methylhydantoinase B/acetone carboxylase, alpha subunit [Candidatus Scalindua japonica]|uniref:N-methylhydantoinase B/acetone carboxylase, alpha subunit n=1 Tax=Candidatus Scalindua japonica TaxID=1284222 RepID=A0A286TU30_9BACT|nr:hydantoinase B/oxoprolinase family protein [Candidatus Scalindua japonica]GAX59374.1 N-methylhydantoinase B/acetone carboxylase, alpha subunit [Candidatus Scalindua japonica]